MLHCPACGNPLQAPGRAPVESQAESSEPPMATLAAACELVAELRRRTEDAQHRAQLQGSAAVGALDTLRRHVADMECPQTSTVGMARAWATVAAARECLESLTSAGTTLCGADSANAEVDAAARDAAAMARRVDAAAEAAVSRISEFATTCRGQLMSCRTRGAADTSTSTSGAAWSELLAAARRGRQLMEKLHSLWSEESCVAQAACVEAEAALREVDALSPRSQDLADRHAAAVRYADAVLRVVQEARSTHAACCVAEEFASARHFPSTPVATAIVSAKDAGKRERVRPADSVSVDTHIVMKSFRSEAQIDLEVVDVGDSQVPLLAF